MHKELVVQQFPFVFNYFMTNNVSNFIQQETFDETEYAN